MNLHGLDFGRWGTSPFVNSVDMSPWFIRNIHYTERHLETGSVSEARVQNADTTRRHTVVGLCRAKCIETQVTSRLLGPRRLVGNTGVKCDHNPADDIIHSGETFLNKPRTERLLLELWIIMSPAAQRDGKGRLQTFHCLLRRASVSHRNRPADVD